MNQALFGLGLEGILEFGESPNCETTMSQFIPTQVPATEQQIKKNQDSISAGSFETLFFSKESGTNPGSKLRVYVFGISAKFQ
ncbi:hypothetical protein VNO77_02763 [Canavalia gladiata]|uniref:Uncharacterized protein n=1 Tax=Canavalia gladiata TaxID=3824 RepID=A0AAN9R7I6_CANGL